MATKIASLNMRIMGYLLIALLCWYFSMKYGFGLDPVLGFPWFLYYGALALSFGYYQHYDEPKQTYYKAILSSWITILFIVYICLGLGLYEYNVRYFAYIYGCASMYLSNRFMNQTLLYAANHHERLEIISEYKSAIWYQAVFCLVVFMAIFHFNS